MNRSLLILLVVTLFARQSVAGSCTGQPDGFFVNDFTACDGYFSCYGGKEYPGTCPDGYVFNAEVQLCDFPWNVKCLICPEESGGSLTPTLEPIDGECSFYTLCFQGTGELRECGEGLLFDATRGTCDLAASVNCETHVCANSLNPNIPTFVPNPTDCSRYFLCFGGVAEEAQCAPTLLFNPETRRCEQEEVVQCAEGSIPTPTCPPTGVLYLGNSADCASYFVCLNGVKSDAPIRCTAGLIFDVSISQCGIPNEASRCADGSNPLPGTTLQPITTSTLAPIPTTTFPPITTSTLPPAITTTSFPTVPTAPPFT